jgi:hypothetical protein
MKACDILFLLVNCSLGRAQNNEMEEPHTQRCFTKRRVIEVRVCEVAEDQGAVFSVIVEVVVASALCYRIEGMELCAHRRDRLRSACRCRSRRFVCLGRGSI